MVVAGSLRSSDEVCSTTSDRHAARGARQTSDARLDRREHIGDVRCGQRRHGMEPHARPIWREHAVEHERVDVHIQIHRPTKALDDGHCAATTVHDAGLASDMAQETENRTHVHPHDLPMLAGPHPRSLALRRSKTCSPRAGRGRFARHRS